MERRNTVKTHPPHTHMEEHGGWRCVDFCGLVSYRLSFTGLCFRRTTPVSVIDIFMSRRTPESEALTAELICTMINNATMKSFTLK